MKKIWFLFFCTFTLNAAEYFVTKDGDDTHDGISRKSAFATINRGIRTLKSGDTLTIGPGEYYEAINFIMKPAPDKPTTIRAQFPGSVLLHGDKVLPPFEKVPGTRFIYVTDWAEKVNAVNERDSYRILIPTVDKAELEFTRGLFFYDAAAGKLYISTSDGEAPSTHFLTASTLDGGGLHLQNADNVIIDGIMTTGFYSHFDVPPRSYGIRLNGKTNAVVRRCKAFFNSNGIHLGMAQNSLIEDCTVYANGSASPISGGNLVVWGSCDSNTVRNCKSFFSTHPGELGIRFYGGNLTNNRIENCVTFGEGGIGIKGGLDPELRNVCFNNYNERHYASSYGSNNVFRNSNAYDGKDGGLRLDKLKAADFDHLFADPENHDFRPQGDAAGIANGLIDHKNIFFVSPNGDDDKPGYSLKTAWKTLKNVKPETTVYLLPGTHAGGVISANGVTLKTRGAGARAVISSGLAVTGKNCRIEDVNFINSPVVFQGDEGTVSGCGFAVKFTAAGKGLELVHNAFTVVPELDKATGFRHSNIYTVQTNPGGLYDLDYLHEKPEFTASEQGIFTLKNAEKFTGRGFDALPLGPYRLVKKYSANALIGPVPRSLTNTTADIEWWTAEKQATSELSWGEDEKCSRRAGQPFSGSYFHTVTLTGLKPGTKYFFKTASRTPPREHHSNVELSLADRLKTRTEITSKTGSFTTTAQPMTPREYFVSPTGSDDASGTRETPFFSINKALGAAKAGDTVSVHGGIYSEVIRFRSGGDKEKPLTLRSVPGEKVWLDGRRFISNAILLDNKSHIIIDGFYFREINHFGNSAGIIVNGGSHVTIRRCFYDGRSLGGTPEFIRANSTRNLTVENCVIMRAFHGAEFMRCPQLTIRHTVWYLNQISHFYIHNLPNEATRIEHNIFFDVIPTKYFSSFIGSFHLESLKEAYNCYYPRMSPDKRGIFRFTNIEGDRMECRTNYPQLLEFTGGKATSLTVNPQCPVLTEHLMIKDAPPIQHKYMNIEHKLVPEAVELSKPDKSPAIEEHLRPDRTYAPLDFADFFPRNPEVIKIQAGLQPEVFNSKGGTK